MNKPSIIRAEHKTKYTVVTNALAQDQNLTYAARGMILTLLSYPDDWTIRPGNLRQKGCGYNKVYKLLNELIEAGYLKREETRDEKKQRRTTYIALEIPIRPCDETHNEEKPRDENHHDGIHDDGIHHVLQSNEGKPSNQEKQSNESLTPSASDASTPPLPKLTKPAPKPVKAVKVLAKAPVPSKKKPAQGKLPRPRKPQRYDPLWNAIADTFFQGARSGNQRLGRILNGQEDHGLTGLRDYEVERQNCPEEKLDYVAMATWIPKFHASLPKDNSGKTIELRDPAKFVERWIGWRESNHLSENPRPDFVEKDYDPDCPLGCDQGRIMIIDEKGERTSSYCTCMRHLYRLHHGVDLK